MKPKIVKIRRTWHCDPVQKPHSTRKPLYDRKENRRIERIEKGSYAFDR